MDSSPKRLGGDDYFVREMASDYSHMVYQIGWTRVSFLGHGKGESLARQRHQSNLQLGSTKQRSTSTSVAVRVGSAFNSECNCAH